MRVSLKNAGIAGILTATMLLCETFFFIISGWSYDKFNNPITAMTFLQQSEVSLRVAVLFGAAGVAIRFIYVAGLASKLAIKTPTPAVAVLYFGIIGGVGHGLIALSYYIGFPLFITLASKDHQAALVAWNAFTIITNGVYGFGNFLYGLMMLIAGLVIVSKKELPVGSGVIGLFAAIATLLGVFTSGTSLASIGLNVYMPSLVLAMLFDFWVGLALWKTTHKPMASAQNYTRLKI